VTSEGLHHLGTVGRTAGGGTNYFGRFAEVGRAHYRRGYDGELLRVLAAEAVKTVHRASGDAQRLSGTDLDWLAVNRPGKDAGDTVQHLLVCVVLVRRRRQLLPGGDEYFKYRNAALESSPVRRNRIPTGPILMFSSEGLTLVVRCCIIGRL
jgi:hypothetical protein